MVTAKGDTSAVTTARSREDHVQVSIQLVEQVDKGDQDQHIQVVRMVPHMLEDRPFRGVTAATRHGEATCKYAPCVITGHCSDCPRCSLRVTMKAIRVRMKQVVGFGEALRLSHAVSASSSTCVCDGVRGTFAQICVRHANAAPRRSAQRQFLVMIRCPTAQNPLPAAKQPEPALSPLQFPVATTLSPASSSSFIPWPCQVYSVARLVLAPASLLALPTCVHGSCPRVLCPRFSWTSGETLCSSRVPPWPLSSVAPRTYLWSCACAAVSVVRRLGVWSSRYDKLRLLHASTALIDGWTRAMRCC